MVAVAAGAVERVARWALPETPRQGSASARRDRWQPPHRQPRKSNILTCW